MRLDKFRQKSRMVFVAFMVYSRMNRYFGFAKYPVLILALLPMGGHLFCCVHCHSCEHVHNEASEYLLPVNCCQHQETPCNHKHECYGNDQPVIMPQRSNAELIKPFWTAFDSLFVIVPVICEPAVVSYHYDISSSLSALPVRLHMLYRLLLI